MACLLVKRYGNNLRGQRQRCVKFSDNACLVGVMSLRSSSRNVAGVGITVHPLRSVDHSKRDGEPAGRSFADL
jgi:hypothetical protein